jgi:hypothetical protein
VTALVGDLRETADGPKTLDHAKTVLTKSLDTRLNCTIGRDANGITASAQYANPILGDRLVQPLAFLSSKLSQHPRGLAS